MRMVFAALIAIAATACEREPEQRSTLAVPADLPGQPPAAKPAVIPLPDDQAHLDRLILAGYTPHDKHMHPPGMNECPMSKGSDVVM